MSKFFEYLLIGVMTLFCIGGAWFMSPDGPSESDIKLAEQRIGLATAKKTAVTNLPDLPSLPELWQRINIDFGYCGLKVLNGTQPPADDPSTRGEPSFWVGQVSGSAGIGLTCVLDAVRRYPIRVVGIRVSPTDYYVRYRVYGVLTPTVVTPTMPEPSLKKS